MSEANEVSPSDDRSDLSALLCDWYLQTEKEIDPREFCPDLSRHDFGETYSVSRDRRLLGFVAYCKNCGVSVYDDCKTAKYNSTKYFAPGENLDVA